MGKEEETKITNRIAIIALLAAIIFGTISVYGSQKFDIVGYSDSVKLALSVVSQSWILIFPLFIVYILGLSMDYRYISKKTNEWYRPFYDLGVILSFFIVIFTFIIIIVLKLAVYFNSPNIGVYGIYTGLVITALLFGKSIGHPIRDIAYTLISKPLKQFSYFLKKLFDC